MADNSRGAAEGRGRTLHSRGEHGEVVCDDRGEKATRDALQMFGGYGYMRDLPLERFCRDIRIASIYEGSSEIQKLIIARDLLREAGEGGS